MGSEGGAGRDVSSPDYSTCLFSHEMLARSLLSLPGSFKDRLGFHVFSSEVDNNLTTQYFSFYSKDVSLPTQLQRAMATEAEAAR